MEALDAHASSSVTRDGLSLHVRVVASRPHVAFSGRENADGRLCVDDRYVAVPMTRHALVAVALACTLLAAGCVGTTGEPTTAPNATATTGVANATTTAGTPATTATPAEDDAGAEFEDVDADALASAGASSLASAEGVVVEGNLTRTVRTPSGASRARVAFVERDDVAARELAIERTVRANGRTVETATYLVNGTFYERSPAYERQYGTEWVSLPADGAWTNASSTAVVARLVNASDAAVAGETTVNGDAAVVLALDVNESALATLSGYQLDAEALNALSGTVTVDADTGRVHAATVHVNRTVENAYGQQVTVVTDVTREFIAYEPVTVSLPDAASEATPINGTQG
ncbi:hypothetical protein [Halorubellus salinus]|uniref:hypothetical protein n=1 Tax=Halorubellus salinus TaxID=755309 RepID=UPI001D099DFF|nr:hypothetical protein [Halorubellus salinus]